ncbi:MAG: hypothetical protein QM756_10590 [Polyangiaceae bacterium]
MPRKRAPELTWAPAWVSRADFARMTGRARSSITEACRPGGPLAAACDADRLNARHPDALRYRLGQFPTIAELAEALGVDALALARRFSAPDLRDALVSEQAR